MESPLSLANVVDPCASSRTLLVVNVALVIHGPRGTGGQLCVIMWRMDMYYFPWSLHRSHHVYVVVFVQWLCLQPDC